MQHRCKNKLQTLKREYIIKSTHHPKNPTSTHLASVCLAASVIHPCTQPSKVFPQLLSVPLPTPGQHVFPIEEHSLHLIFLLFQSPVAPLGRERGIEGVLSGAFVKHYYYAHMCVFLRSFWWKAILMCVCVCMHVGKTLLVCVYVRACVRAYMYIIFKYIY